MSNRDSTAFGSFSFAQKYFKAKFNNVDLLMKYFLSIQIHFSILKFLFCISVECMKFRKLVITGMLVDNVFLFFFEEEKELVEFLCLL